MIVVIDPGHGGKDPGAVNPGIVQEKEINLKIAERVADILFQRKHYPVLTREEDIFLELWERVQVAHDTVADCFVSVHCNSYDNPQPNGIEVLYHPDKPDCKVLAQLILMRILKEFEGTCQELFSRGLKERDDLYVLRKNKIPAVLVECAFLSNPHDVEILNSDKGQRRFANGIANGIQEFHYWLTEGVLRI